MLVNNHFAQANSTNATSVLWSLALTSNGSSSGILQDPLSVIDYSRPENRLIQSSDGTFKMQEKPLGYVIGEQVIRPLINGVSKIGKDCMISLAKLLIELTKSPGLMFFKERSPNL